MTTDTISPTRVEAPLPATLVSAGMTAPRIPRTAALPTRKGPAHRADTRPKPAKLRALGLASIVGAGLVLSGCSVPGLPGASGAPDGMTRAATVEPEVSPSSTETPTAAPAEPSAGAEDPEWVPVEGDLDAGSVTHELSASARTVVIDYWVDDDVSKLTPDSSPIIRMNARIDGEDDGTVITVTRFNAQVKSLGVELANDTGSFALTPPYSYASAVSLPANPDAHSTEVLVTLDLLTETEPESGVFTRQTVLDTVSLAYGQPPVEN